jgi:hypothetical protein
MAEMKEVVANTGPLTERGFARFEAGRTALARHRSPMPRAEISRQLTALLPEWG